MRDVQIHVFTSKSTEAGIVNNPARLSSAMTAAKQPFGVESEKRINHQRGRYDVVHKQLLSPISATSMRIGRVTM